MSIKLVTKVLLLYVFMVTSMYPFSNYGNPGTRKVCKSATEFKNTIPTAAPGDTIELVNGVYDLGGNVNIITSGTSDNPILIRAQNRGYCELSGQSCFDFKQVSYVILEGFLFTGVDISSAIKTESCNYVRITKNTFRLSGTNSSKWVYIGGTYNMLTLVSSHNRIDHNLFEEKHTPGNFITLDGTPSPDLKQSQYDQIDHNYFKNIGPRATNEMESIRVGWSDMSKSSGFTTIEYNLFEDCDGDPEFISVKSCDNIVRFNTFRSCMGVLSLRHGNRSVVEGNFFFGNNKHGTGGIRVYGTDHKIYNNYLQDLNGTTWDAPFSITCGDVDSNSTSLSSHFRPVRAVFVNNTLVNNIHDIEMGYNNNGSYGKPPKDITIADNIVVGSQNELVKYYSAPLNTTWMGNIMFPTGLAVTGISVLNDQIKIVDPRLTFADSIWRLSSGSPAIDSSRGNFDFVVYDIDGQLRNSARDIGSDEYAAAPCVLRPLSSNDVGPDGGDIILSVERTQSEINVPLRYSLSQNYPNPFNPSTRINFIIPMPGNLEIKIYNIIGQEVASLASGYYRSGEYSVVFNASKLTSSIYIYKINARGFSDTKKMILIK